MFARHPFLSLALALALACLLGAAVYYRALLSNLAAYQYWLSFKQQGAQHGFVPAGDASLYYEVHGEGTPLVLLHGGLANMNVFFGQLPALSRTRRVITIDLRGQGRSSVGDQAFTYRLLASDVLAVLDELHISTTDIVGWSDGGIIGLVMAMEHPGRMGRLVAIGANFDPAGLTDAAVARLKMAAPSGEPLLTRLAFRLQSPEPERWEELWQRINLMWLTRPVLTTADLGKIRAPTLVIVGEKDMVELGHAREMADSISHAELVIVPGAGHNLLVEKPALVLDLVRRFTGS